MAKRVASRRRKAAELRAEGLSLRQTAERLGVSFKTVHRDLEEWDRAHPKPTSTTCQNQGQNDTADVRHGDFRTALSDLVPGSVDVVLTDPPYPREFLPPDTWAFNALAMNEPARNLLGDEWKPLTEQQWVTGMHRIRKRALTIGDQKQIARLNQDLPPAEKEAAA